MVNLNNIKSYISDASRIRGDLAMLIESSKSHIEDSIQICFEFAMYPSSDKFVKASSKFTILDEKLSVWKHNLKDVTYIHRRLVELDSVLFPVAKEEEDEEYQEFIFKLNESLFPKRVNEYKNLVNKLKGFVDVIEIFDPEEDADVEEDAEE